MSSGNAWPTANVLVPASHAPHVFFKVCYIIATYRNTPLNHDLGTDPADNYIRTDASLQN